MQRTLALIVSLLLIAMTSPVAAEEDVQVKNEQAILALVGDAYDPDALITMPDGRTVTGAEALDAVVERLGTVDLGDLESTQNVDNTAVAGDLFLIEFSPGSCNQGGGGANGHYEMSEESPAAYMAGTPWGTPATEPYMGTGTSVSSFVLVLDRANGDAYSFDHVVDYTGFSDFYCVSFFGYAFNLPYVQGVVA